MEDNKETLNENIENEAVEEVNTETTEEANTSEENSTENELEIVKGLKEENSKLKEEIDAVKDRLLRLTAEYDNYRKRTAKEKEGIYADAYIDVLKEVLPIIDNLERAAAAEGSLEDLKKGVEMTMKGCQDAFAKLGVEEIDASGEFDPNFHNAVMHEDNDEVGENIIVEEFQKGYIYRETVVRHSMVKVAN